MPFKSYAIRDAALLGAKEHVAAVERDHRAHYCYRSWETRTGAQPTMGCILSHAVWAVEGEATVVVDRNVVEAALGLKRTECAEVVIAYEIGELGAAACAHAAYDVLASLPVAGSE